MIAVLERYLRAFISCDAIVYHLNNMKMSLDSVTKDKDIRARVNKVQYEITELQILIRKKLNKSRYNLDKELTVDFDIDI